MFTFNCLQDPHHFHFYHRFSLLFNSSEFAFVDTITLLLFYAILTVSNSSKHSSISVLVKSSSVQGMRSDWTAFRYWYLQSDHTKMTSCIVLTLFFVSNWLFGSLCTCLTTSAGPFYYNCNWCKYKTMLSQRFKHQPHKMVEHTQTICRLFSTNCLIVLDHFVRLALNEFTAEGFSETRTFMHVSKHVFRSR